jgi:hypothetical protein
MREFLGLIIFIVLLCIWSFVFADGKANSMTSVQDNAPAAAIVASHSAPQGNPASL